jgi:hypothetical protein
MAKRTRTTKPRTGTLTEFAKAAGITKPMVSKLRAMGVMNGALIEQPGKKRVLVDIDKALKLYNERVDPNFRKATRVSATGKNGQEQKPKASGQTSFIDARSISEQYKAAKLKLEYEINKGLWLEKSVVKDDCFRAARLARDSFLNIPSRVAALVAAESQQGRCYRIIHKEIKDALDDFIRQLKTMADKRPTKKRGAK